MKTQSEKVGAMKRLIPLLVLVAVSGCGTAGRLANIGRAPKLSPVELGSAPAIEPSLGIQGAAHRGAPHAMPEDPRPAGASLFRSGGGGLFRDQRASRVGDILTIRINIADKAAFGNTTSRSRTGSQTSGVAALLGLQKPLAKILPGAVDPSKLVDLNSASDNKGAGSTSRSETVSMTVAAVVVDVLPNGNMLIRGRQEMRVNYELRELVVTGVVRPEDIGRDNSIQHSQIAEARISYGGRGQLTDVQQARWGQQLYDALFPF